MAQPQLLPDPPKFGADAVKAMNLPVGMTSPLWIAFAGAAAAGATFWWMSRMFRPTNLEAMGLKPVALVEDAGDVTVAALEEAEAVAETTAETAFAAVAEAAPEPVAEALEALAPEPVAPEPEPVVEAAPEPEPVAEVVAAEPEPEPAVIAPIIDDLTRIVGIGPKLSVALAERGLTSFAQLAALTADELADLDKALDLKGRALRNAWVSQATEFAKA